MDPARSEARDLIERRTAEADLRRGVVSILPKGRKLIEAVVPTSEAIYAEIAAALRSEAGRIAGHAGQLERSLAETEGAHEADVEINE